MTLLGDGCNCLDNVISADQFDEVVGVLNMFDPPKRRRKLGNAVVFRCVCLLLITGIPWKYLSPNGCSYSTVYKRFNCWVRNGVVQKAWHCLLERYATARMHSDPSWFKELFIDSSMIKNVAGADCLGKSNRSWASGDQNVNRM